MNCIPNNSTFNPLITLLPFSEHIAGTEQSYASNGYVMVSFAYFAIQGYKLATMTCEVLEAVTLAPIVKYSEWFVIFYWFSLFLPLVFVSPSHKKYIKEGKRRESNIPKKTFCEEFLLLFFIVCGKCHL